MNEQDYQELREQSWRRRLTQTEDAALRQYLAAHPDAQEDWLSEAELNGLLQQLPDAPVASNFTARVVQAAQLEAASRQRSGWNWPAWMSVGNWLPKGAVATLAVGLVLSLGYHQHQNNTRAALARNVVQISDAVSASDPELMQDFEPIRQLGEAQPKADIELIALMK
jgi:anti-sigma factor RsiW